MQRTIVISTNASWNILNFRRGLAEAFQAQGWRVVALSPDDAHSPAFAPLGITHVPIAIDSAGVFPAEDLGLFLRYYRLLRRIRPDVFLGYTAKPNIYGSLAAHALGIPVINNISGLGTVFIEEGVVTRIVKLLYRLALRRSATVFFQNPDDEALFLASGLASPGQTRLLPGSGIDLDHFAPVDSPRAEGQAFTFLLVGRLLWQKGVAEYVEAARLVRLKAPDTHFQLLGFLDVPNRSAVGRADLESWVEEGLIEYLGATDDVRPHIAAADAIVLPSYREGLPRSLLEGAAMGKPLIATDVPGCREIAEEGVTGFLCAAADAPSFAQAMLKMIGLSPEERAAMGAAARRKVESGYGDAIVVQLYLEAIGAALNRR